MRKTTRKKIAPIVVAVLVIVYIALLMLFVLGAMGLWGGGQLRVMFPLLCWLIIGGAVIVGVLKALGQRLREIDGGEEEDASQY